MKISQHAEQILNNLEKALKKPAMDDCEIDEREEEISSYIRSLKTIVQTIEDNEKKIDTLLYNNIKVAQKNE